MSDSSRETLIDYMLGRLTPEAAAAFEERVRRDPDLSRDLELLRGELGAIGRKSRRGNNLSSTEQSSDDNLEEELERLLTEKKTSSSPDAPTAERTAAPDAQSSGNDTLTEQRGNSDEETSEITDAPDTESSDAQAHAALHTPTPRPTSDIVRRRRLHFIPKRVTAPRRIDASLVYKRAAQLSTEERARRLARPSRLNKAQLRATLLPDATYALADAIPTSASNVCVPAPAATLPAAGTAFFEESADVHEPGVAIFPGPIADDYSSAVDAAAPIAGVAAVVHIVPDEDARYRIAKRGAGSAPTTLLVDAARIADTRLNVALATRRHEFDPFDAAFDATIITGSEPSTRFTLTPLEYADGRANHLRDVPTSKSKESDASLYPFSDLTTPEETLKSEEPNVPKEPVQPQKIRKDAKAPLVSKASEHRTPVVAKPIATEPKTTAKPILPEIAFNDELASAKDARSMVEEWIAAEVSGYTTVFPGARIMPQSPNATISAAPEPVDADDTPYTLTAEDKRLAELLGREPDPIELGEYYWEEDGAAPMAYAKAASPPKGIFGRLVYVVTAPPVWIGRKTIESFTKLVPTDVARKDARNQTRRQSSSRREPARFSDAVISVVAGVALAAGVVFPALKYVVHELFVTVATSKVRNIGDNITFSPGATDADVLPFISEQILFPHYEAVEFDANGSESVITVDRQSP